MKIVLYILIFIAMSLMLSYAQQNNGAQSGVVDDSSDNIQATQQSTDDILLSEGSLPSGINGVELGMTLAQVKMTLAENLLFYYVPKHFSTGSAYDKRIIAAEGRGFIDMAYFYFSQDDILISFSLFLDEEHITYGTILKNFQSKYGRSILTPQDAKWSDGNITLSVEYPLSIKFVLEEYIPTSVQAEEQEALVLDREEFLNYFK